MALARFAATRLGQGARALCQVQCLRTFADGPAAKAVAAGAGADDDIVLNSFKKQLSQNTELMKNLQSVKVPLNGDDAAIRKYAQEVEAIKKKVGLPDVEEVIDAELNYKLECSGGDVHKFLVSAIEGVELGSTLSAAYQEVLHTVEEIESSTGELTAENEKGWETLVNKVSAIQKKHGLEDIAKVKEESIFEMYKQHVKELSSTVREEIEMVKKREHLEWVDVDPASLKPKLA